MGKRIITQRRGRGTTTYRAHSFRWSYEVRHRVHDDHEKTGVLGGVVADIVNSKGHSAPLALIKSDDGQRYIIFAPLGIRVNDKIFSGHKAQSKPGNTLPLEMIPEGTQIYNIETKPYDGGSLVRSAGSSAKVVASSEKGIQVVLPSKKKKIFNPKCRATIGVIAGSGRKDKPFVKAGKRYHLMKAKGKLYPRTSAVKMNSVDHPFGSGRGKNVGKPKTPPRFAPPGRNVGLIRAKRTGKRNEKWKLKYLDTKEKLWKN